MLYNRDGSEYYHLAEQFSVGFENAFSALRRVDDSKKDMERLPTLLVNNSSRSTASA